MLKPVLDAKVFLDVRNGGRFEVEDTYQVVRAENKLTVKTPYRYIEATISNGLVLENFFAYIAASYNAKIDAELGLYEKALADLRGLLLQHPMSFSGDSVYFHDASKTGGITNIAYFKASYLQNFLGEICLIADTIADTSVLMSIRALNRYYGSRTVGLLMDLAKKRFYKPLSDAQKQRAKAILTSIVFNDDAIDVSRLESVYRYIIQPAVN